MYATTVCGLYHLSGFGEAHNVIVESFLVPINLNYNITVFP